jgi:ABC-2 type transport system permease protein
MTQVASESKATSLEGNVLPTSMQQVGVVTKYEMLNYFRSRRFFILLIIDLIIGGALTGLVGYYRPSGYVSDLLGFYSNWWGMSATYIVIFSAVFFGGDAISGEFQNKTGYFLLGNPIRRSSIYVGKWFAALIASLIILGIFTGLTIGNSFFYFGAVMSYRFGESFLFTLLYLIAALGFTFFFSSLLKSSAMSILVTVILFLFGFSLIDLLIANFAQTEPWFILTYGSSIISNVLTDPYPDHKVTQLLGRGGPSEAGGGRSITVYNATIPEGIAIMALYFIITAVLGLVLFERKEFT